MPDDGYVIFKSPTEINLSRDPDYVLMGHDFQTVGKHETQALADFQTRGWVVEYSTPDDYVNDWMGSLGSNSDVLS